MVSRRVGESDEDFKERDRLASQAKRGNKKTAKAKAKAKKKAVNAHYYQDVTKPKNLERQQEPTMSIVRKQKDRESVDSILSFGSLDSEAEKQLIEQQQRLHQTTVQGNTQAAVSTAQVAMEKNRESEKGSFKFIHAVTKAGARRRKSLKLLPAANSNLQLMAPEQDSKPAAVVQETAEEVAQETKEAPSFAGRLKQGLAVGGKGLAVAGSIFVVAPASVPLAMAAGGATAYKMFATSSAKKNNNTSKEVATVTIPAKPLGTTTKENVLMASPVPKGKKVAFAPQVAIPQKLVSKKRQQATLATPAKVKTVMTPATPSRMKTVRLELNDGWLYPVCDNGTNPLRLAFDHENIHDVAVLDENGHHTGASLSAQQVAELCEKYPVFMAGLERQQGKRWSRNAAKSSWNLDELD